MSKQPTRGGMGSKKHGRSGYCTRSPKYKYGKRLEGERDVRKPKPSGLQNVTVDQLFRKKK